MADKATQKSKATLTQNLKRKLKEWCIDTSKFKNEMERNLKDKEKEEEWCTNCHSSRHKINLMPMR